MKSFNETMNDEDFKNMPQEIKEPLMQAYDKASTAKAHFNLFKIGTKGNYFETMCEVYKEIESFFFKKLTKDYSPINLCEFPPINQKNLCFRVGGPVVLGEMENPQIELYEGLAKQCLPLKQVLIKLKNAYAVSNVAAEASNLNKEQIGAGQVEQVSIVPDTIVGKQI